MKEHFKITLSGHIKMAKVLIWYILIACICNILILLFNPDRNDALFLIKTVSIVCIIFVLPALYLHLVHYLENKNWQLTEYENELEIHQPNGKIAINQSNILALDLFMCANMVDHNFTGPLPIEEYYYAKITTVQGEINISRLLYPNIVQLQRKFPLIKVKFHKTIFADI